MLSFSSPLVYSCSTLPATPDAIFPSISSKTLLGTTGEEAYAEDMVKLYDFDEQKQMNLTIYASIRRAMDFKQRSLPMISYNILNIGNGCKNS